MDLNPKTLRHPLVDIGSDGKPLYPGYHFVVLVWSIVLASSAYPVFKNTASHLPITVSFFWFSIFAFFASLIYPNDLTSGVAFYGRRVSLRERFRVLYPISLIKLTKESHGFDKGFSLIALATIAYISYFMCLLWSLSLHQEGVVVTIVVLQQLSPIFLSLVGLIFLGDNCKSWFWYIVGSLTIASGVFVYKYGLLESIQVKLLDQVFLLMLAVFFFEAVNTVARAKYRRVHGVDGLTAVRTMQFWSALTSFFLVIAFGNSFSINFKELAGLVYLGFVPTAFGQILTNRVQDAIGIPITKTVSSFRPLFILLLSFLPIAAFRVPVESFGVFHIIGILTSIVGLTIVMWFGKPEPVVQKVKVKL